MPTPKPQSEEALHGQICDYLKLQYREVVFRSDHEAGRKRHPAEQGRIKRMNSSRAWPDLFLAEPRAGFHGLFIEIKKAGTRIKKQDGHYVADPHIREQALMLHTLGTHGYMATFGIGFDHCKDIIDEYLALPKPNYTPPEYNVTLPEPTNEPDDGTPF